MGVQLPSFIATVEGLKPAMDLWISASRLDEFTRIAKSFGLRFYIDALFDRHDEITLGRFPSDSFNTTRAVMARVATERCEAHIFVARNDAALSEVVSSGWYPLVVGALLVSKPYPDHRWFGRALGYPECCRRFFLERNDWRNDNTYFAAYARTEGQPLALCNTLTRHTALYLAPHIPCSFSCLATEAYSAQLATIIRNEARRYADAIIERLREPMLCLSETRIFLFDGRIDADCAIVYRNVAPISPTTQADAVFELLKRGDRVVLENCVVRVMRRGRDVGAYFARSDIYGPEVPFVVECG
jgi:hypothetical protein